MTAIYSLAELARTHAAERGDKPAITFEDRTVTFRELNERSNQVANALAAEGVGTADRVAILDKNSVEYFELLFGGAKLNAVNVAVNWRLAAPEIAQILDDSQASVVVVGQAFTGVLDAIAKDLSAKKIVVVGGHDGYEAYDEWVDAQPASDPGAEPAPDDVCFQLYTSGTTGLPKGVMLTNDNLFSVMESVGDFGITENSVNLVAMPLFHIGGSGYAMVGMYTGCHSVLLREVDPAAMLALIPEKRVSNMFAVPAVLQFMLMVSGVNDIDFSSLETICYGASPISVEVLAGSIKTFGSKFVQLYGMTETTGAVVALMPEDHDPGGPGEYKLRAAGKAMKGVELRIVDPDTDGDATTGDVGEIWVRSRQNMRGYWRKDAETANTLTTDGWVKTGDAGYLDADGYLYIHDRVKDMIISGGENIYPAEVENCLMSHPGIADVAAFGVPSEKWGESVHAAVVKAQGAEPTPDDIIAFARERLAHFKCPTSVTYVDALPRNPSGKILRRELRAPFWADRERSIG
ncbi:MAG: hypothetical protein QOJ00_2899 [Actinomycetota bacterium]